MRIELKNVKVSEFASQETTCFEATIWIDGAKAGSVRNQGHGGCNLYHFDDPQLLRRFESYCRSLPPEPATAEYPHELPMDADLYLSGLLERQRADKQLRRWCRTKTVFRLNTDKPGEYGTVNHKYDRAVKNYLTSKYGERLVEIVNETLQPVPA